MSDQSPLTPELYRAALDGSEHTDALAIGGVCITIRPGTDLDTKRTALEAQGLMYTTKLDLADFADIVEREAIDELPNGGGF